MLKTFRRSACLLFVLTLAAAIVVPTVADPIASVAGDGAQAGTSDDVLLAEDYELSEDLTAVGEPKANDLVSVIVKVDAPSLLEYANGKGIDVQDAMLRSEGVRVLNKIESVSESAKKALSPYLVSTGASYNTGPLPP